MFEPLQHIDWQLFHFLRPRVLWLFVPLGICILLAVLGNAAPRRWRKLVPAHLQPYLFSKGSTWAPLLPLVFLAIMGTLAIIGIAGPAWHRTIVPGQRVQAVVLVAMDLSASMNATDIQPTRLERAKMKLKDFLHCQPGAKCGLLAYAGTPHLVMPFTRDSKLIDLQASSLSSKVIPVPGTNTTLLLQYVDTLLRPVLAPSTVLLLTDAISEDDANQYSNYVNTSVHRLEVLLMSSPQGAPVPGFKQVTSRQDENVLAMLRNNPRITINPLTLDATDVAAIAKRVRDHLIFEKDEKADDKSWDDMGYLAIAPVGFLLLLWFRRGWAIQWCLLLLLLPSCNVNSPQADWWYTKDYQGQVLYKQQHYKQAEARFEDVTHKGAAAFKAGDYETAAALFALDSSAAGEYNRGLALAKLGRYDDAEDAFKTAAMLDSSLEGKAGHSLEQVSKSKLKVDSVMLAQKPTDQLKEDKKNGKFKERKPQAQDEKLSADTRVKNLPKTGERNTDEVKVASNIFQESNSMDTTGTHGKKDDADAMKHIILRRPPADPALFLQKRFALQRKRTYANVKPGTEKW